MSENGLADEDRRPVALGQPLADSFPSSFHASRNACGHTDSGKTCTLAPLRNDAVQELSCRFTDEAEVVRSSRRSSCPLPPPLTSLALRYARARPSPCHFVSWRRVRGAPPCVARTQWGKGTRADRQRDRESEDNLGAEEFKNLALERRHHTHLACARLGLARLLR
ncbi:kinesin, putative [Leishmania tarentolae]|uniref:Kinesin, putative n=1 Tax=Leishmania tarentolae TaxID=5689 RepID=A0A640KB60_LEITA|nr:kinesin, putative [Leishmania tarentolae]